MREYPCCKFWDFDQEDGGPLRLHRFSSTRFHVADALGALGNHSTVVIIGDSIARGSVITTLCPPQGSHIHKTTKRTRIYFKCVYVDLH